mmetsp:Transcript_40618/g.116305  ORF Transcript_40618/g.116305 Transcript_40618/m.116305 type:complete len:236 (+) Transcript_40618:597-1304(+)
MIVRRISVILRIVRTRLRKCLGTTMTPISQPRTCVVLVEAAVQSRIAPTATLPGLPTNVEIIDARVMLNPIAVSSTILTSRRRICVAYAQVVRLLSSTRRSIAPRATWRAGACPRETGAASPTEAAWTATSTNGCGPPRPRRQRCFGCSMRRLATREYSIARTVSGGPGSKRSDLFVAKAAPPTALTAPARPRPPLRTRLRPPPSGQAAGNSARTASGAPGPTGRGRSAATCSGR